MLVSDIKCTLIISFIILSLSACSNSARANDIAPVSQVVTQASIAAPAAQFAVVEAPPAEVQPQPVLQESTCPGKITNRAEIIATNAVVATREIETALCNGPILTIEKTSDPNPAILGKPIIYTLTYNNIGDTAATDVVITDIVPANAILDRERAVADGWDCSTPDPPGQVTCTFKIARLDVGKEGVVHLVMTVPIPISDPGLQSTP